MSWPCSQTIPGHDVTFEQIAQAPRFPHRIVQGLDVVGKDTVVLTIDGDTVQLRFHDVSAIIDVWEHRTGIVTWNPTARLLTIVAHHPWEGFQSFHLADGPYVPCTTLFGAEVDPHEERADAS